jgi:hypothetical protein
LEQHRFKLVPETLQYDAFEVVVSRLAGSMLPYAFLSPTEQFMRLLFKELQEAGLVQ